MPGMTPWAKCRSIPKRWLGSRVRKKSTEKKKTVESSGSRCCIIHSKNTWHEIWVIGTNDVLVVHGDTNRNLAVWKVLDTKKSISTCNWDIRNYWSCSTEQKCWEVCRSTSKLPNCCARAPKIGNAIQENKSNVMWKGIWSAATVRQTRHRKTCASLYLTTQGRELCSL